MLRILGSVVPCVIGLVLGRSLSLFASVVCSCCPIKFSLPLGVILMYTGGETQDRSDYASVVCLNHGKTNEINLPS